MKNTLLLAFSTICLTQTMLTGCGSFSSKSAKNNGDKGQPIYNVATRYDVKSLDPASVQDWTTAHVLSYLYASIGEVCELEAGAGHGFGFEYSFEGELNVCGFDGLIV